MVLASVISKSYRLPLLFFLGVSVAYADSFQTDHITVYGASLTIYDDQGACYLKIDRNGKRITLPVVPRAPCYFLRYADDEVIQQFSYPKQKIKAVFIIGGTPVTPKDRKTWSLSVDELCGTRGQGLILDDKGFRLSQRVMGRALLCKFGGRDEKDFWTFAHEKPVEK